MLSIIKRLAATSKRTEKEAILKSLTPEQATSFKEVAALAYDPFTSFYITKYPEPSMYTRLFTLSHALKQLSALSSRRVSGKKAAVFLTTLAANLSEDDAKVLRLVIDRDLDCGATKSTFNKIWPELIYDHPYMRCSSFNAKNLARIKPRAFSQTKEDGLYTDTVVTSKVEYRARSGSFLPFKHTPNEIHLLEADGFVLMGEALARELDGTIMPRKKGNGYLNSGDVDPSRVCFVYWDMVPLNDWYAHKCTIPYEDRLAKLTKFLEAANSPNLMLVDSREVNTVQEIIDHFKENVLLGREGTVIKNRDMIWEDGDSKDQIKVKLEFTCELKIVGIKEGSGKYVGMVGAYACESADGIVQVSVGGGLSDKLRAEPYDFGSIIEVKSNDLVDDRSSPGQWSLFLPRHVKLRKDKTSADTYEKIVEQRDAFIHTLKAINF